MATFSPMASPSPRVRGRLTPQRRLRQSSRMPTPARASMSLMDVDDSYSDSGLGRATEIYATTDQLSVSFYADLPVEVRHVLSCATDLDSQTLYFGAIDTLTGFAVASSAQACFVWQHAQTVKGIPTCYIFSTPCEETANTAPFSALVPYGPSREPGLVLVSPLGQIRFWDSIGLGLAGADHFSTYSLELHGQSVTTFVRVDPQLYVASTSDGHLFRINLTSVGGKHHLTIHPFSVRGPGFSITGLIPSLFGGSSSREAHYGSGYISAISFGSQSQDNRDLWVLVDRRLQLWKLVPGGREELIFTTDLADRVRVAIHANYGEAINTGAGIADLELLDLAVDEKDRLAILVSYAGWEDDTLMNVDMTTARRIYAIVFVKASEDDVTVESVRNVPHESTINSAAPIHPRIQIALGHIVVIQFGDAVGILSRDSDFSSRLELKGRLDQTIGIGVLQHESSILILTTGVMMKVTLDLDSVKFFDADTGRAHLIKSVMLQAILYGSNADNPLKFSFPPELDEDALMIAAEQLSSSVLRSDPDIITAGQDLNSQMLSREARLIWLIRFINENQVLHKMAQRSRQKLAFDAEKMYSCHQLWLQHNDFLQTHPPQSVLRKVVLSYMDSQSQQHNDPLRAFFRLHIQDIPRVLQSIHETVVSMSRGVAEEGLQLLPEANNVVLVVINSALEYREHNLKVYGVEFPMTRPWTSKRGIIDLTINLFETTVKYLDATRINAGDSMQEKPSSQLPELVAVILGCVRERLDWLSSDPDLERERSDLLQKYQSLRPDLMNTLCRFGYLNAAMSLAEKDRDFASLVALCHRDTVYPPEANPHAIRIQQYIENYKADFTVPLFQWYIQHGELRLMFSDGIQIGNYLDRFFAQHPHPNISWSHNLQYQRFGDVASSLEQDARSSQNLGVKHFKLSLGKLAYLADREDGGPEQTVLDKFHSGLDFVSVHDALLDQFRPILEEPHGRISSEARLDAAAKRFSSGLSERPSLANLFKAMLHRLLGGNALSDEDLLDVLTLKDNRETPMNFDTAVNLLDGGALVPISRRKATLRTIWRRVYIQEDWTDISHSANLSEDALTERLKNTALFHVLLEQGPARQAMSPDEALEIPTKAQLAARWPGLSEKQVEALEEDFNLERDILGELDVLPEILERMYQLAHEEDLVHVFE